jgi:hypothetical protein
MTLSGAADAVAGALQTSAGVVRGIRLPLRAPVPAHVGAGHVAVLGGTLTFGQGVARPYPSRLEAELGVPVINLGCRNAGVDAALGDAAVMGLAARAAAVVVQVTGAQAVSNPFYRVHPRRNDRVIAVTDALRRLYPEIDFAPFSFTGHLLRALAEADAVALCGGGDKGDVHAAGASRFAAVVAGLQAAWVARMRALLRGIGPSRVTLLWVGAPAATGAACVAAAPGWHLHEPAFVTHEMIDALRPLAMRLVTLRPGHAAGLPGAQSHLHRRLAEALAPCLRVELAPGVHGGAGLGLSVASAAARRRLEQGDIAAADRGFGIKDARDRPVPPAQRAQPCDHVGGETHPDDPGWIARDDRIGGHGAPNHRTRANDHAVADPCAGQYPRATPHPDIVPHDRIAPGRRQ